MKEILAMDDSMIETLSAYRNLVKLTNGENVMLRALVQEDRDAFMTFFAKIPPEELALLRDPVDNPKTVVAWIDDLDYGKVFPLVAVTEDHRIVADATLHFRHGGYRHVAEVRMYLDMDYRQEGLGHALLHNLITIARGLGLHILIAHVVATQGRMMRAFRSLGFEHGATLDDFFMAPTGETHDVALLTVNLEAGKGTDF
jgi:L-amino acid N-acyltransferase YncA